MKQNLLKYLWQKKLFRIIVFIIVFVLIGAFFINRYWSPILANKVKNAVLSSSDSLYRINFSDANLHVLEGRIVLYNIVLTPDTAVYNKRKKLGTAPDALYELRVKKLILRHVHPFTLYFHKKLDINQIVLSGPDLQIRRFVVAHKQPEVKDNRTLWQKISGSLKLIHAGQISLHDVTVRFVNDKQGVVSVQELKDLNLEANDLLIDSATQFDKSRFMFCKEVKAELNNYAGKSDNGLYHYQIKQVTFSTLTRQLNFYGFNIESKYKPIVFFEKTYRNRFSAHLDTVQLNDFDFDVYNRKHVLSGSSLVFTRGSMNIFSNPRTDPTTENIDRISTFPNAGLFALHADFKIDTIKVHDVNLIYEELNTKSGKTGHISFNNSHGYFYNVATDSDAIRKNPICTVQLYSGFMNRGRLDVMASFNLMDKERSYSYKGTLGPMNLTNVNAATVPLALLKINNGTIKRFVFDIHGNRAESHGAVSLQYNDLKVSILKADSVKHTIKHATIETLFANAVVISHNNPDKPGDAPRSFNVSYKRPYNCPFFKAAWQTLLIGIKSSAGLDQKKQEEVNQKMTDRVKKKAERKVRKEMRKERRAERKQQKKERKQEKELEKQQEKQSKP